MPLRVESACELDQMRRVVGTRDASTHHLVIARMLAFEPQAPARTVDTQLFSTALLVRVNETGVVYAFGNANGSPNPQIVTP